MCEKCGKLKPAESPEKRIEEIVKHNGTLIIATQKSDYDSDRNFIGDYSEIHQRASKYVKMYNPDALSVKDYKKAREKGELPWQK